MIDIAELTPQHFDPLVGQDFIVSGGHGTLAVTLDNIKIMSEATKRDNHIEIDGKVLPPRRAFALVFAGPPQPLLSSQIHRIDIPGLGAADLFMVPFRQDQTECLYEVSFS